MNLFNNTLPTEYEYGGRVYEFQTDFREWIKFELLLTDSDIPITDKARRLTEIIFPTVPPDERLWEFLLWLWLLMVNGLLSMTTSFTQNTG